MTPEEIANDNHHEDADTFHVVAICDWLKEIAFQLARINERLDKGEFSVNTFEQ